MRCSPKCDRRRCIVYGEKRGSLRVIKRSLQNNQITTLRLLNQGDIPLNMTDLIDQNDKFIGMVSLELWARLTYEEVVNPIPAIATKVSSSCMQFF